MDCSDRGLRDAYELQKKPSAKGKRIMNRLAYVTINFSELLDRRMTLEDEF